jgi:uncharacterized protein YkwD
MTTRRLALLLLLALSTACSSPQPTTNVADDDPRWPQPEAGVQASVLAEINLARTQPARFAEFLAARRPYFSGRMLRLPGRIDLRTQEGLPALDEAIAFLRSARPLPPLTHSPRLARAAADHVRDQGPDGLISHAGSDGSSPFQRMDRYVKWTGHAGENISFGPQSGREIVLQLIVDDGVFDRGHRISLFTPTFRKAGVAFGPHRGYRWMCVIDLVDGFSDGGS